MSDYLTLAELKTALSQTGSYADASLQRAITAASRAIDKACNRRFWLDADATQVRYYKPRTSGIVIVDDVVTVTSVEVDRDGDGVFEEPWVANTEYIAGPVNAAADGEPFTRLELGAIAGRTFPERLRAVKVTGRFGWPAVPAGIVSATAIMANRLQKREREAPFGVAGTSIDGAAVRIPSVDPDVRPLIDPFVRRELA